MKLRIVVSACLVILGTLAIPAGSLNAANAASVGGLDVVPSKGNAYTLVSVVTERGCTEPAKRVSAVLLGKGMPATGQIVVAPNEIGFSTTRPMELPVSNAFVIYARNNKTTLAGTYTLKVRCTDRIGVRVIDEFATKMTWKTPGNKLSAVDKATFTAVSSAGVVKSQQAAPAPVPAPAEPTDKAAAPGTGSPSTPGATASPTPIPLANQERPDGSNPTDDRVTEDLAANTSDEGSSSSARLPLLIGGALLVAAALALLAFRSRRSTP